MHDFFDLNFKYNAPSNFGNFYILYSSENKQQLFARNSGQDLVMPKNRHNSGHVAYFRGCLFSEEYGKRVKKRIHI